MNEVIADSQFVAKARAIGMEPRGGTPEDLDKFIRAERTRPLGADPAEPEPAEAGVLKPGACAAQPASTRSAPFSPIMIEAACVLEAGSVGMTDESITRRRAMPCTRS